MLPRLDSSLSAFPSGNQEPQPPLPGVSGNLCKFGVKHLHRAEKKDHGSADLDRL